MIFNREQTEIFESIENDTESLVVEARAGTGKTTTGVEACNLVDSNKTVSFVAFNKSIAEELKWKVASNVKAMTSHSMGYRSLLYTHKGIKVDENKCRIIFRSLGYPRDLEGPTLQLVSLAKTSDTAYPDFPYLVEHFDLNIEADELSNVTGMAATVLEESLRRMDVIDLDDMVYLPALGRSKLYPVDYLFIDEAQDMNAAQLAMFRRAMKFDSRLIAIGDRNQSIYGFRGADSEAIPRIIADFDAKRLPLSTCYRCAAKIIEQAQKIVPEIQARPGAPDGEVVNIQMHDMYRQAKSSDLILCRVNAPLVATALTFIANGVKAQVLGTDIGRSVALLVDKVVKRYHVDDVKNFVKVLGFYENDERQKLIAAEKISLANALQDKVATLMVICMNAKSIQHIYDIINTIFSDNIYGVTLSSVHKAKGKEADNVFILKPELLPHPNARGWQVQQEMNLKYVAITRARSRLAWVME